MSEVLPTPSKRQRDKAVEALRSYVGKWPGYLFDLREVAKWLESMGDDPEEADGK